MVEFSSIFSLALPLGCIIAMYCDLTRFEIPNLLCIVVALAYLPFAILNETGWQDIGLHYLVGLAALGVGFLLFILGVFGGGDSKFIAAVILWFDIGDILPFIFYTTIFGGLLAILFIGFRSLPLPKSWRAHAVIAKLHSKKSGLPYALAIGGGGLVIYPQILP
jgi:prepilin peptidase CpaA